MRRFLVVSAMVLCAALAGGESRLGTLDIYVIDVEGGNATLFVSPSGQSLLIDTGNLVGAERDADRIMAAARDAGISQIDHLIITHWHGDHYGGVVELVSRIPIRHFIDHGPNVQPNPAVDEFLKARYPQLYGGSTHTVARAGDQIVMAGLDVRVLSSAGQVITAPLPGGGLANSYCATFKPGDNNAEDRSRSSRS
jgi:beta-lactamase superfamily II metal-dependent hydrolase